MKKNSRLSFGILFLLLSGIIKNVSLLSMDTMSDHCVKIEMEIDRKKIQTVAMNPQGNLLMLGTNDAPARYKNPKPDVLRIYDIQDSKEPKLLKSSVLDYSYIRLIQFNTDGSLALVVSGDAGNNILLCDLRNNNNIKYHHSVIKPHLPQTNNIGLSFITKAVFDKSSKKIMCYNDRQDNNLFVIDISSFDAIATHFFSDPRKDIYFATLNELSQRVIAYDSIANQIVEYDISSYRKVRETDLGSGSINLVAGNEAGTLIAVYLYQDEQNKILLYDTRKNPPIHIINTSVSVMQFNFIPDCEKIFLMDQNGNIILKDIQELYEMGKASLSFEKGIKSGFLSRNMSTPLIISSNAQSIIGSDDCFEFADNGIKIFNRSNSSSRVLKGHQGKITTLLLSPDNKLVAFSDSLPSILSIFHLKEDSKETLQEKSINALDPTPEGPVIEPSNNSYRYALYLMFALSSIYFAINFFKNSRQ